MQYKHLTDHKKSIMLFLVTFILYALVYMTKNCYSAAMASIVDAGIMTKSQTGLIAAVFYLVYAPFQIVGGIAADKHSPLKLITIGVVGAGIANLLIYLFNSNYIAMMVIWACNAVVQFGVWPSVFRIIATQLAEEHRSKAIVYISLSSVSGLLLSYLMAVFITEWQYNFLYSSIILFCIAVVFVVVYKYLEKDMVICEITLPEKSEKNEKASEKEFSTFRLIIVSGLPLMFVVYIVQNVLNLGIRRLRQ